MAINLIFHFQIIKLAVKCFLSTACSGKVVRANVWKKILKTISKSMLIKAFHNDLSLPAHLTQPHYVPNATFMQWLHPIDLHVGLWYTVGNGITRS